MEAATGSCQVLWKPVNRRAPSRGDAVAHEARLPGALDLEGEAGDDLPPAIAGFYARFGFKPTSAEPLTLMVPLEAVRRTVGLINTRETTHNVSAQLFRGD